jgi:DNA-binding response OmpR family regulator
VPTATQHRKVRIFGDEASIRNLLRVFREKLKRENAGDASPVASLAVIDPKTFDAVLLDLRCSNGEDGARGSGEVRSCLMGKVLAITAEVRDPETLDLIERYLNNDLPRSLLWLVTDP